MARYDSISGLVQAFEQFDRRRWIHRPGMETVRHAVHDFVQSAEPFLKDRVQLDQRGLAGVIFELCRRLLHDVVREEGEVVNLMEQGFAQGYGALHRRPSCGIQTLLCFEWWAEYPKLNRFIVAYEDGEKIDEAARREAVIAFVNYMLGVAVLATRMSATALRHGVNDINRDPTILGGIWIDSANRRLEHLERRSSGPGAAR